MIHTLSIRDYGVIKAADLELAAFTVIVGKNRSGKSTILRALRSVVFNKMYGTFRHGQTTCRVYVKVDDNNIIWNKSKTTSTYTLNDTVYSKLAGGVPAEITEALGIRAVEVDSTLTLVPQLHQQGEYAFLLDKPAGQAARALARMTRLDVVIKAQQLCKAKVKECKDQLKAVGANIDRTAAEIAECPNPVKKLQQIKIDLPDLASLKKQFADWIKAREAYNTYKEELKNTKYCKPLDGELGPDIIDYQRAITSLQILKQLEAYPNITIPSYIMVDLITLHKGIQAYDAWWEGSGERGEQESALKSLKREKAEIIASLPEICPVCGK